MVYNVGDMESGFTGAMKWPGGYIPITHATPMVVP